MSALISNPHCNPIALCKNVIDDMDIIEISLDEISLSIRPRSISIPEDHGESINVAPLVLTASEKDSWGESNRTLQIQFDEESDRPGQVTIASVVWEPKGENKLSDTRIIVFTDTDFLTNAFIGKYSNATMGLNVINWLSELEYQVFVDYKEVEVERLDLTSK